TFTPATLDTQQRFGQRPCRRQGLIIRTVLSGSSFPPVTPSNRAKPASFFLTKVQGLRLLLTLGVGVTPANPRWVSLQLSSFLSRASCSGRTGSGMEVAK